MKCTITCVFLEYFSLWLADVTNPRIEKCTPFALGVAYPNSKVGHIKWSKPRVTDNSNDFIQLQQNVYLSPRDNVSVGPHEIIFTAKDKAGNKAKPCKMTLQMKGIQFFLTHKFIYFLGCFMYSIPLKYTGIRILYGNYLHIDCLYSTNEFKCLKNNYCILENFKT